MLDEDPASLEACRSLIPCGSPPSGSADRHEKRVGSRRKGRYTAHMRQHVTTLFTTLVINCAGIDAYAQEVSTLGNMAACKPLPRTIQVIPSLKTCGNAPAVLLSGPWRTSFSAAFRWEDGSSSGQDRNPSKLNDASAASSPYKTQRRIRGSKQHVLCYGNFLTSKFPTPEQLTIKRTVAPKVDRFCVDFPD